MKINENFCSRFMNKIVTIQPGSVDFSFHFITFFSYAFMKENEKIIENNC